MKALTIKTSFIAALIAFVICAAGIEGGASLTGCAIGMSVCVSWMGLVAVANKE